VSHHGHLRLHPGRHLSPWRAGRGVAAQFETFAGRESFPLLTKAYCLNQGYPGEQGTAPGVMALDLLQELHPDRCATAIGQQEQ
jgi:hypothetical protein